MNKFKLMIFFTLVFLSFSYSINAQAAETEILFPINEDYSTGTFLITVKEAGEYFGYVVNENYDMFPLLTSDDTHLTATVDNITKGTWKILINSTDKNLIPDVRVSFEGSIPDASYNPEQSILVGKDITGLKVYFEDDNVVLDWSTSDSGNVNVKVINLDNNVTLANSTVVTTHYECNIPKGVKTIMVSAVPSTSANIPGAAKTFTLDIPKEQNAEVTYAADKYVNKDYTNVYIDLHSRYGYYVLCDELEVLRSDILDEDTYLVEIPVPLEGTNIIRVYLYDDDNNRKSYEKTLIRDTQPPKMSFLSEYDGLTVTEKNIEIEGKVQNYKSIFINDNIVTPSTDGYFKFSCILHEGINNIHVISDDDAGNISESEFKINYMISEEPAVKNIVPIIFCVILIIVIILLIKKGKKTKKIIKSEEIKDESESLSKSDDNIDLNMETNIIDNNDDVSETDVLCDEKNEINEKPLKNVTDLSENKSSIAKKINGGTLKTLIINVLIIGILLFVVNFIVEIAYVPTGSMTPYINEKDFVIGIRTGIKNPDELERGDVITFLKDNVKYVKRVIGKPGEMITFRDGNVFVNNELIDESEYIDSSVKTTSSKTFIVPNESLFVMGDNREDSFDARYWSEPYIPYDSITSVIKITIPTHSLINAISDLFS